MRECDLFVLFLIRLHVLYLEICIALLPECKFGPPLRGWPTKSYKDCVCMRVSTSSNICKLHPAIHRGKWARGLTKSHGILCEMASKGRKCLFPMSVSKENKNETPTHTSVYFHLFHSRQQDTGESWQEAGVHVHMHASQCVFILSFDSTVEINQFLLWRE